MTHAELLRSHADAALREGGMYYSGEYLSRIATVAESLEAENAKLKELVRDVLVIVTADGFDCYMCVHDEDGTCEHGMHSDECLLVRRAKELGVEIDE